MAGHPPPLGRQRLATPTDAHKIMDLINESISKTFRIEYPYEVIYLIENAILSILQLDTSDNIIGFLSLRDYPTIPSVHPSTWESFLWAKYKAIELNARNTLFISLLCWNPKYSREVVDRMLTSVFMHDPYVHYIVMIKSLFRTYPLLVPGQSRAEASFRRIQVLDRGINADVLPALFIADRKDVSPRLRVRRAVEEDNDDLVPIIANHSARLQELYGEFYISELVSRHPESDRVLLVCEMNELAVGVMCLNSTVNYEALEESYVLSPFGGLRHLNLETSHFAKEEDDSNLSCFGEPVIPEVPPYTEECKEIKPDTEPDQPQQPKVQVCAEIFETRSSRILDMLYEDEDEDLEYDIVNIDTEHLRVPEVLCPEIPRHNVQTQFEDKKKTATDGSKPFKEPSAQKSGLPQALPSRITLDLPEPVRYKGSPNAFIIELFAMHPERDERYGFDILETAFEMFPNRDYCIISLPSNQPPCPLLEHFTPVTPIGTRMRFINESLYVAHVNSVRGNMGIRQAEHYDEEAINILLNNTPRADYIKEMFFNSLTSKTLQSFVILSERQPVGLAIVGPLDDATVIRTQYELEPEPRRPGTDGAILAGILSPILEPHSRWFLRELMRQTPYSTFFWICRLFTRGKLSPTRNLMSLASHMNPVHLRRALPNISGSKDLDNIYHHLKYPFALWVLEKPMTSIPKVYVNDSIVVVGASRTGLAFLETLLMGPASSYLTFSNVTLVSENGLATVTDCLKAADICVPRDGRFTDRYIKCTPFYFYVDVISSTMVGIDRKKKCIQLKGGATKYYDTLVLTCGQQFQHPAYMQDALELAKEVQEGKPCDRLLMDNPKYQEDRVPPPPEVPTNVFLINSLFEANIGLRKLMRMITDIKQEGRALSETNQVVVYGDCIEAYSCIAALLELGIQPKMIVFLEPFPSEDVIAPRVNCFNDEVVDERVQESLKNLGVNVIRKCYLAGWQVESTFVRYLELMTPMQAISYNCFALFFFGLQAINALAFKAINECGLVYDGGLVVSPTFETNDPNIYGAGTIISYSRRLYATRCIHRDYSSEDIGEALARLFLKRLDPFVKNEQLGQGTMSDLLPTCTSSALGFKSHCSLGGASSTRLRNETLSQFRRWQPVMKFSSPTFKSATLPGPLYYMKVRKAGKEVPMGAQQLLPRQGHRLVTDKNGNYFYLRLNVLHVIEAVTCLSHEPLSVELLIQLFGKHEATFNNLLQRFLTNRIDDFYAFFTQSWMSAQYQESFMDLMDDIKNQDLLLVKELTKSKYTMFDPSAAYMGSTRSSEDTLQSLPMPNVGPQYSRDKELRNLGTFRSIIEKYIVNLHARSTHAYFPSECGMCLQMKADAKNFWDRMNCDEIVTAHLKEYLEMNTVINPHYARVDIE